VIRNTSQLWPQLVHNDITGLFAKATPVPPLIAGNAEEQARIDNACERRRRMKIVEEELVRLGQAHDES
jgi:hypothetical protein